MLFQVIVSNVGTVYSGDMHRDAVKTYQDYKKQSESMLGRAGGESVTLMEDGEPILEHEGVMHKQDEPQDDMDGDHASALASAGMGTDEDYGGTDERI